MICILAGSKLEALRWAEGQALRPSEWFYPDSIDSLLSRVDFHVIVVGTFGDGSGANSYFERMYSVAKQRGGHRFIGGDKNDRPRKA